MITRSAWHDVWNRPGPDTKTRRVIALAITLSLARWEEFDLHARAALMGDDESRLTPDEIKEVLMQAAIYAGVPAANTAFAHVGNLLREAGELDQGTPVAMAQTLCEGLPDARLAVLQQASHLSVIEQPAAVAGEVQAFIASL